MDYNFLTGVERGIERAERVIGGRGIAEQEEGGNQRNKGPAKGEVNLNQALERCGVRVERVPKGMSRGLKNRTGWNKKWVRSFSRICSVDSITASSMIMMMLFLWMSSTNANEYADNDVSPGRSNGSTPTPRRPSPRVLKRSHWLGLMLVSITRSQTHHLKRISGRNYAEQVHAPATMTHSQNLQSLTQRRLSSLLPR